MPPMCVSLCSVSTCSLVTVFVSCLMARLGVKMKRRLGRCMLYWLYRTAAARDGQEATNTLVTPARQCLEQPVHVWFESASHAEVSRARRGWGGQGGVGGKCSEAGVGRKTNCAAVLQPHNPSPSYIHTFILNIKNTRYLLGLTSTAVSSGRRREQQTENARS